MRAGKDIYCEKPLTLTVAEGRTSSTAQQKTGRILQTGTQQRSSVHFRLAVDLVRNGRIGTLKQVEVWLPAGLRQGPFSPGEVPAGFNYDFWQGQTPTVPYVKERTHFSFRYWWEYSGGTMTDWGAHHNDIVLWTLGTGRLRARQRGRQDSSSSMIPGGFTAAQRVRVEVHLRQRRGAHLPQHDRQRVARRRQGPQRPAARHQVHRHRRVDLGDAGPTSTPATASCCASGCPRARRASTSATTTCRTSSSA